MASGEKDCGEMVGAAVTLGLSHQNYAKRNNYEFHDFAMYVLAVIAGVYGIYLSLSIIYNTFISPLRSVPGPLLAKLLLTWMVLIDAAGDRTQTIHKLHQKYGPVVRIGPSEVSFSDRNGIKDIYGQNSVYLKAPMYDSFSLKPPGIFSMRDKAQLRERRNTLRKVLRRLDGHLGKPRDVLVSLRMLALNIVELLLDKSFRALERDDPPAYVHDLDYSFIVLGLKGSFPVIFIAVLLLPLPKLQHFLAAPQRVNQYGRDAFTEYMERHGRKSTRKDLLTKLIMADEEQSPLDDREIWMECGDLVFAGTDTTSTTLTYLFWELSQRVEWQDILRKELDSISLSDRVVSYRDVNSLRVLDAVIMDALRLHPAAPASLSRECPTQATELAGFQIPPGTVVSMQCYTTQRDPEAFPEPERFNPTRWLEPQSQEKTQEMNGLFMPFSKGTRACLGKNLALMELKLVVATITKQYRIALGDTMTLDDMDLKDHFLAVPKGGKCDLVFTKT